MKYGSICSGIEAATVAWHPVGWTAAWLSEIDPFPCAVLAHHYPGTPNLGDISAANFITRAQAHGPIDVLVGGTPCQSFSVAGLRGGLDDDRGNLALQFARAAEKIKPAWVIWENVPGVLSSSGGRDFGSIIGGLAQCGYGCAYRVLDAQYFGVPQRRRRVFVVGHLGDWRRAAAVLFERDSLSGHPGAGKEKGQDIAACLGGGSGSRGWSSDTDRMTFLPIPDPAFSLSTMPKHDHTVDTYVVNAPKLAPTVTGGAPFSGTGNERVEAEAYLAHGMKVRRLTPRECERLQGFPDDYTLIPYRGKPAADAPRYKALGNSMAVPVMEWIGKRIDAIDATV